MQGSKMRDAEMATFHMQILGGAAAGKKDRKKKKQTRVETRQSENEGK